MITTQFDSCIYSGSGNTFCVTTERPRMFPVVELCLQYALDGVIFFHDNIMRIFNNDGSEAEMCGNGLRCLIAYLWDQGDRRSLYEIQTLAGLHKGQYKDGEVSIVFPQLSNPITQLIAGSPYLTVDTGVPHAVFDGDLKTLETQGPAVVRAGYNLTAYWQEGTFYHVATYERGLEKISPACGTGCLAAAIAIGKPKISVQVPSGEQLTVTLTPPTLTGGVAKKETIPILDLL